MPVPCSNELMATLACVLVSSPSLAKDFPFETRQNRSLSRREEREREREREREEFSRREWRKLGSPITTTLRPHHYLYLVPACVVRIVNAFNVGPSGYRGVST